MINFLKDRIYHLIIIIVRIIIDFFVIIHRFNDLPPTFIILVFHSYFCNFRAQKPIILLPSSLKLMLFKFPLVIIYKFLTGC